MLGCDFDESKWRHVGAYNRVKGCIEMHLEALSDQRVMIDGQPRDFQAGERIHSENSYKYDREEFAAMLRSAGFSKISSWTNDEQAFWVFHAS